jgi:hypothetical protein
MVSQLICFLFFDHTDKPTKQTVFVHAARINELAIVYRNVRTTVTHVSTTIGENIRSLNDANALNKDPFEQPPRVKEDIFNAVFPGLTD